jgi:hypothetical protein
METEQARTHFKNPSPEFRPVPFWFWNDHLDSERLVWQFNKLLEAGMGGAVLHARGGLPPDEYLDSRWFAGIEAVVNFAAQQHKIVWLYDELGWPSGTAAGSVTRDFPEFQMYHLKLIDEILVPGELLDLPGETVAAFVVTHSDPDHGVQRRNDGSVSLRPDRIVCEPIPLPFEPESWMGKRILFFQQIRVPDTLNYFDPQATAAFLKSTHVEYYQRFRSHFGATITHIFMDEAGMCTRVGALGWDPSLAVKFQQRRGYALIPQLPALYFDLPGCEAVRFDYWSLVTELFREGFAIPLFDWCQAHKILYSGHYVFETTLKEAVRQSGSIMPLYEFQGLPGIDILGCDFYSQRFDLEAYSKYLVNIKQAASVTHQLAKPGLMSESHGVGGNALSIEDMQTVDNFQMALGVTTISQHAPFYSIRGQRKLDCPPIIGWQQPYWPFIGKHSDTVSRTAWLLRQGSHQCEVLLLHPASSLQATYRHSRSAVEYKAEDYVLDADLPHEMLDKHFLLLSVALLDAQIDFDFGDEEIMARHGQVAGTRLQFGKASYRIVALPPLINLRQSTWDLLRNFAATGGIIVSIGSAPHRVDGRPVDALPEWIRQHSVSIFNGVDFFDYAHAVAKLAELGGRKIFIQTRQGQDVPSMKIQHRIWDDKEIFFITHISREPVATRIQFAPEVTGHLETWDLATGNSHPLANCEKGVPLELFLEWAPRQARAFVAVPGNVEIPARPAFKNEIVIEPDWAGQRNQPNCLVLDACQLRQPDFGAKYFSISEAQPALAGQTAAGPVFVNARFRFRVLPPPTQNLDLAIELPEAARVTFNGQPLSVETEAFWLDPALRRISLSKILAGENILEIEGHFVEATDFQSPILLGNFELETRDQIEFQIKNAPAEIPTGSWVRGGLPFYAGTVTYQAWVEIPEIGQPHEIMLDLAGLAGAAEIRVNGKVVDHILWPPYRCDLSEAVLPGKNRLEIEIANTLRNLFGPHFDPDEMIRPGFGAAHYQGKFGQPKRFRDYGLLAPARVVIRT